VNTYRPPIWFHGFSSEGFRGLIQTHKKEAKKWFQKAAEQGIEEAKEKLRKLSF
jgi:TPR repeat protein